MSATRPGVLRIGAQVRFDGVTQTVAGLSGALVHLAGRDGQASVVHLGTCWPVRVSRSSAGGPEAAAVVAVVLGGVPEDAAQDARRWERHIVEVLTGSSPDAPEAAARPGYDPAVYSLAQRERAKAAELAAAGEKVTARTVKRKRQRYQARGVAGLVDWRADRARPARGRTDERVVAALQQAISEQAGGSTRTAGFTCGGPGRSWPGSTSPNAVRFRPGPRLPAVERVTAGFHANGSARTRQSLAAPRRPFSRLDRQPPG